MRSLVRTRTLTALCVLLLAVASIAHAGVPGRPIDRPGGPPDPDPTMVGDPDAGHNGLWAYWKQLILAIELGNPQLRGLASASPRPKRVSAHAVSPVRARR